MATAACLSSQLTPPSPRGSTGERGGCQQKVFECGFVCQIKKNRKRESVCMCSCVSDLCPHVWLSPPRAGQNGAGRRAPNWAQMAATDRDGGGINTLINNYLKNDTGYTRVGGRGTEGQEGRLGGRTSEEIGKMRGFEKARRKSDREGKGRGQDGMGEGGEERKEVKKTRRSSRVQDEGDEGRTEIKSYELKKTLTAVDTI